MRVASSRDRLVAAMLGLALFALYLVMHPYRGIEADALIYVTRIFASPTLLQGDLLFSHESQTGLTIFSLILSALKPFMQVGDAARLVALCGVAVWFAGVLAVASAVTRAAQIAPLHALAMAALVSLAPLGYAPSSSFATGEFLAVPRPFAEGFVLMACAAMLERRWLIMGLALAAAFAFHPLMGLAGASVLFTAAAWADRRLWIVAALGVVLALTGAAMRLPFLDSLLQTFDAEWLGLLRIRTSYLFLSQAPVGFWVDALWRAAVIIVAAHLCEGDLRRFLWAVLAASALALVVSLLFADVWPSVLVTRLQPWRVLFIPAVIAPVALVVIAARSKEKPARLSLALLACAYMTREADIMSVAFSLAALAPLLDPARAEATAPRVEKLIWLIAAAAWISFDLLNLLALGGILAEAPANFAFEWRYLWALRPLALPLAILTIYVARQRRPVSVGAAALTLALAGGLAIWRFDDRTPLDRSLEARAAPEIVRAVPGGAGAVLWLSLGKEAWYWLDRPNWIAPAQASSIVFSRELALAWAERTRFITGLGLYAPEIFGNQAAPEPRTIAAESIAAVCERGDGPSAIVAPLRAGDATPEGASRVEAPAQSFQWQTRGDLRVVTITSYAVWSCARG